MRLITSARTRDRAAAADDRLRGQRLQPDIDQNAKGKYRILLQRALGTERDRRTEPAIVERHGAAVQHEQRFFHRDEVAYLLCELDHAIASSCHRHERRQVDG